MKKMRLPLLLCCSAVLLALSFQSCVKDAVKDLFAGFNYDADPVAFTIPVINSSQTGYVILDTTSASINVNQVIKDQLGGSFSLDDADRITLTSFKLKLDNADMSNNWANFQSARVMVWSNTNTTPVQVGEVTNIPDSYATDLDIPTNASLQMKDYMSGQTIYYMISGQKRRNTTRELGAKGYATFRVE